MFFAELWKSTPKLSSLSISGALHTLSIWTQLLEQRVDSVDPDQMCEGVHHFPYSNISINGLTEVSSLD